MADIVGPGTVGSNKNLYFKVTDTFRDQNIDPASQDGNFVIDIDGVIYKISDPQPNNAAITVIGGRDTFSHEKADRPYVFYITQKQKVAIYKILKELAKNTNKAELHSDNTVLDHIISSTYTNYCG